MRNVFKQIRRAGAESTTLAATRLCVGVLSVASLLFVSTVEAKDAATLWRVERPGVATGYLLAVEGKGSASIPAKVQKLLDTTTSVVFEMDLEPSYIFMSIPSALDSQPPTIAIDAQLHRQALARLQAHRIGGGKVPQMKPWALALALDAPPPKGSPLELRLWQEATKRQKAVKGLEILPERGLELDQLSTTTQEGMVRTSLARGEKAPILMSDLLRAWSGRDLTRLQQHICAARLRLEPLRTDAQRQAAAARLLPMLEEGSALAVVDARQVADQSPLLKLLKQKGWRVTRD